MPKKISTNTQVFLLTDLNIYYLNVNSKVICAILQCVILWRYLWLHMTWKYCSCVGTDTYNVNVRFFFISCVFNWFSCICLVNNSEKSSYWYWFMWISIYLCRKTIHFCNLSLLISTQCSSISQHVNKKMTESTF